MVLWVNWLAGFQVRDDLVPITEEGDETEENLPTAAHRAGAGRTAVFEREHAALDDGPPLAASWRAHLAGIGQVQVTTVENVVYVGRQWHASCTAMASSLFVSLPLPTLPAVLLWALDRHRGTALACVPIMQCCDNREHGLLLPFLGHDRRVHRDCGSRQCL